MAGVQEIQELKRVAEMRSQLRTVSEAGVGGGLSGAEPRRGGGVGGVGSGPARPPIRASS